MGILIQCIHEGDDPGKEERRDLGRNGERGRSPSTMYRVSPTR